MITLFLVLFSFLGSVVGPAFDVSWAKKTVASSESETPDPNESDTEETDSSGSEKANKDKFLFSLLDLRTPDFSRLALNFDSPGLNSWIVSSLDRPPKSNSVS